MAGWINATLAFDGLLAAGPEFDRDKVIAATNAITDFTAGGLIEPVDWTQAHTPFTNDTRPDDDDGLECAAAGAGRGRRVRDRGAARDAVAVLPAWHRVGGARAHQLRLIRGASTHHAAGGVGR